MTNRILVVDDEPDITALVAYHLAKAGYRVSTAGNGPDALKAAREERPDIVVLDVMLPGVSGYDVLAEMRRREETKEVGVILLTARREEADRIRGLSLGADDYLTKPFSPAELALRVNALLRRLGSPAVTSGSTLTAGPIAIDRSAHRVAVDAKDIDLTATEYKLLLTLVERRGRVQTRPQLLETVWEAQPDIQTRTVDMHVQRLRSKLGDAGDLIETVRGFGYRFRGNERGGEEELRFAGRLVLGTILVVVFVVLTIVSASEVSLRRDLEADIATSLEREARLVTNALPSDSTEWEATVKRLGAESGLRITLIDSVGRVRAESDVPEERVPVIENHANRPEVIAALQNGVGSNKRTSATIGEPLLYVAVRGGPGVVRVAARIPQVDRVVKRAQHSVLGAALLALVIGCILATIAARSVARPLTQITGAARAIAQGSPPRFPRSSIPDVNALVRALREMNNQFGERFEALKVGKAESVAIVEAMAEGVIAADSKGHIVIANAAARRLLGYETDAQLPELAQLFRAKAARDVVSTVLAGMTSGGREMDLGDCVVMLSGRSLPGGGALLVLHDVTEVRRLEAVRRDFVANVSHELKTPLTSISGYAETLVADQPDALTTRRFLEVILANARRMHRLVDGLLDLSKIESGGWRPVVEPLDAPGVVRETWGLFAERAAARNISFVPQFDHSAGTIQADPDALRQILTNLFDNALRYTAPGGRVTVKLEPDEGGVRLSVSDNGSGITTEHLPRIFERFYRADPARSREEGGTGLGLAIVKHLVEAHGGSVEAESQWGQGTTISCWFPAPTEIRSSPDRDSLIAST